MIATDNIARRPTWAEIDLDALAANFRVISERVGPEVKVMAAVKADAYGHGAVEVARVLAGEGVEWLAVSSVTEGVTLRRAGIRAPILVITGFLPHEWDALANSDLTPAVPET